MQCKNSTRGNVVFFVLIAVGLFAALIYAMTKDNTGFSGIGSEEKARLNAEEIIQYGNGLRAILDHALLTKDPNVSLTPSIPPTEACVTSCNYELSGQYTITGVGSPHEDLVMLVSNVKPTLCKMANSVLDNKWTTIPTDATPLVVTPFDFDNGNFGGVNAITLSGVFEGKRAFCYSDDTNHYVYVHVVRAL